MSTIPRSRSSSKAASTASPSGRSNSASQAGSSATSARSAARLGQRLRQRREHAPPDARGHRVERAPGVVRRGVGADQQPAAVRARRVGGDRAPAQLDGQPEVARDGRRQQRDEVGVARQARVHAGPRALGDGGAAGVLAPLEHEHGAPGAGEVGGGDEAVVAAADDHGIVARHGGGPRYCGHGRGARAVLRRLRHVRRLALGRDPGRGVARARRRRLAGRRRRLARRLPAAAGDGPQRQPAVGGPRRAPPGGARRARARARPGRPGGGRARVADARLASAGPVAGRRRRAHPAQAHPRDRPVLQRPRRARARDGQARRAAMGRHPRRGGRGRVQATAGGLPAQRRAGRSARPARC